MNRLLATVLIFTLLSLDAFADSMYTWGAGAPITRDKSMHQNVVAGKATDESGYCQGIREVAIVIAHRMHRGRSSKEMSTTYLSVSTGPGEAKRLDPSVQEQLVDYIYGFKHYSTSNAKIGDMVYDRCLNGVYNPP